MTIGSGVVLASIAVVGLMVWANRWQLGIRAVAIVDPEVRQWAAKEVKRLSEGAYRLTSSPIRVDAARRRIAIDTVVIVTDLVANGRRKEPLPVVSLRFRNCVVDGIDLNRLSAGRGLRIARTGCDSVTLIAEAAKPSPRGISGASDSNAFLTLRQRLHLPRSIPFVRVDTVSFPQVRLAVGSTSRSGRRTAVAFERLAVRLDSLHYDPKDHPSERGTLLSRNVAFTLDDFEGSRASANRLGVRHLTANLVQRTVHLDGLIYEPLPGGFGDSLGFTALSVAHLALHDVDWRVFLTEGDVSVGKVNLDSVSITIPTPDDAKRDPSAIPRRTLPLAATLRALDRPIRVDSLAVVALTLVEGSAATGHRATTSVAALAVAHVRFDNDSANWSQAFPVGPVTLLAQSMTRRTATTQLSLARLTVDVPAGRIEADSLRIEPPGNDADYLRRNRYRRVRNELGVERLVVLGAQVPEYLQHGSYRIRRAEVTGFALDAMSDKGEPRAPGGQHHLMPQDAVRALDFQFHADTITVSGRIQYRERERGAPRPGILTFDSVEALLLNVSTDPRAMSDSTPMRFSADARLMGAGALHVEVDIPLLAPDFRMAWRGSLGGMEAMAFNPLIVDANGMRFTRGHISGVRFDATVRGGVAKGRVAPRWEALGIEVPGLARGHTNIFGQIQRGIAKLAANAFVVRDDNPAAGEPPLNGIIAHRWTPSETLLQFLWFSLREGLLPLLKN